MRTTTKQLDSEHTRYEIPEQGVQRSARSGCFTRVVDARDVGPRPTNSPCRAPCSYGTWRLTLTLCGQGIHNSGFTTTGLRIRRWNHAWSELPPENEVSVCMRRPLIRPGTGQPRAEMARLLLRDSEPRDHRFVLFAPQHYESRYGYPLVVWLHGPGGTPRQLQRVMPLISMRNYVGVAPALPPRDADSGEFDRGSTESAVGHAVAAARKRFHIRADRVFLLGCQESGTMALRLALDHPQDYAGVVSFGGCFPTHAGCLVRLHDARQLPLMLAVGARSRRYPEAQVCRDLRLLHAAGMSVAIRQYPVEDELTTVMLADANTWMMEIITGAVLAK